MRRVPPLGKASLITLAFCLIGFAVWQRYSFRLASVLAWVAALVIFWLVTEPPRKGAASSARLAPALASVIEWPLVVLVFVVAAVFRFVLLDQVPPILVNDEAMFVGEGAWRPEHTASYGEGLVESWPPGWFPYLFGFGWNSFSSLSYFVHWLPATVLGFSNWGLRCGAALVGTLSVVVVYCWVRRWWGGAVALVAALALSINTEHLRWSRIALNNIDAALVGGCTLAALAWALDTRSGRAWVALGYALGAGFYTYHGAKLHLPLTLLVLAVLALTRRVPFSLRDVRGVLLTLLAAFLVTAPLLPDIAGHWSHWVRDHSGRVNVDLLVNALSDGNLPAAWVYVRGRALDSARLMRPAPLMAALIVLGTLTAIWKWKDPRYLTALIWMAGILVVGSLSSGWRSARLIGAAPVVSLMPALLAAQVWAWFSKRALLLRGGLATLGLLLLVGLVYEAWWVQFVWRAYFRNETFGLCRVMAAVPLPATFLLAGQPDPLTPREALPICALPPDERRKFVTVPCEVEALPDLGADPEVVALVFADRPDVMEMIGDAAPDALVEPFHVHGIDPYAGDVPGLYRLAPYRPGSLRFHAVRLRSAAEATPLLAMYQPSDDHQSWMGLSLPRPAPSSDYRRRRAVTRPAFGR